MLAAGRARVERAASRDRIELVEGRAEALPFEDALVRRADLHVPAPLRGRPGATLARARPRRPAGRDDRVARVRRPARAAAARGLGALRAASGCPLAGRVVSPGWREVGRFLGAEHPRLLRATTRSTGSSTLWREAGIEDVRVRAAQPRRRRRRSGAGARDRGPAGLLRARARRLARLRHAAPPAVHALAPELRRDRRGARAGLRRRRGSAGALAAFCARPRASARTRSTS